MCFLRKGYSRLITRSHAFWMKIFIFVPSFAKVSRRVSELRAWTVGSTLGWSQMGWPYKKNRFLYRTRQARQKCKVWELFCWSWKFWKNLTQFYQIWEIHQTSINCSLKLISCMTSPLKCMGMLTHFQRATTTDLPDWFPNQQTPNWNGSAI